MNDLPDMSPVGDVVFLGVDLGWYGKPSGLASIAISRKSLYLRSVTRLDHSDEILRWIEIEAGHGTALVAVDAPLVICNPMGIRDAERELSRDFWRFHAGCYPANLSRPFAENVLSFSQRLTDLGFGHGADMSSRRKGRFQIEVHPHAATVNLFDYPKLLSIKADDARIKRGSWAACVN